MNGLFFNFEDNDLVIDSDGNFDTVDIGSQNCALISSSQVCRLTAPQVGEQLLVKIMNRKGVNIDEDIRKAEKAVEKDGGKDVSIVFNDNGELTFSANYDS